MLDAVELVGCSIGIVGIGYGVGAVARWRLHLHGPPVPPGPNPVPAPGLALPPAKPRAQILAEAMARAERGMAHARELANRPPPPPDRSVEIYREMLFAQPSPNTGATGAAYERRVAAWMAKNGWEVTLTPPSGDFGADVLARDPSGHLWAVQAKAWQKAVGVSAVQEVTSARLYYHAHRAAVVAQHGFTPAARSLAARTGVRLIALP